MGAWKYCFFMPAELRYLSQAACLHSGQAQVYERQEVPRNIQPVKMQYPEMNIMPLVYCQKVSQGAPPGTVCMVCAAHCRISEHADLRPHDMYPSHGIIFKVLK